jgi:hypothetical protein
MIKVTGQVLRSFRWHAAILPRCKALPKCLAPESPQNYITTPPGVQTPVPAYGGVALEVKVHPTSSGRWIL